MRNPIPFDWNGTDWCRFSICWPDSPQWLGLLRGFITYGTRGRSWDERTGNIKTVQAIGWEIANNNLPLQEVAMTCQEANNVAKAILVLASAVSGTSINFSTIDVDEFLSGSFDFQAIGLANRIGPGGPDDATTSLSARLDQIRAAIDALETTIEAGAAGEDLEDDLAKVWQSLDDITEVLGGTVSPAPEPL